MTVSQTDPPPGRRPPIFDAWPAAMQAGNPFRHPDWRRRRADTLIAGNRRCSARKDDRETFELVAYLREAARPASRGRRDRPACRWPGLAEPLDLGAFDSFRPAEIEARILAGQTDDEIATLTHLPAEAVAWFEKACFDVRGRMRARDWITRRAIGHRPSGAATIRRPGCGRWPATAGRSSWRSPWRFSRTVPFPRRCCQPRLPGGSTSTQDSGSSSVS